MNRTRQWAALAALLGTATAGGARATPTAGSFYATAPTGATTQGYYVWGDDTTNPRGFSIGDMDGSGNPIPLWDFALDPSTNDIYMYSRSGVNSQLLRLRADTGQVIVGPTMGRPVSSSQADIWGGTSDAPRDGLGVETFGFQNSLNLLQQKATTVCRRTAINFNNLYAIGTDTGALNAPNSLWYFQDKVSGALPITMNDDGADQVHVRTSLRTDGTFQHMGDKVGFYGAAAVSRPVIQGCRSDGTAVANLLQQLQTMGLITDQTTP